MIAGIVVTLPFCSRPVCLPVMFRLVVKGTNSASRLWLARRMTEALAGALPGRAIRVVADAAYAGKELRGLDAAISWTTRLRKDAALYSPAPPGLGTQQAPRQGPAAARPGGHRRHRRVHPGRGHPGPAGRHRAGCRP